MGQLETIREAQKKVSQRIGAVLRQLQAAEKLPGTQPFVSIRRVQKVSDLRGTARTLQQALQQDLLALKAQFKELRNEANKVEKGLMRQRANRTRREFHTRAKEILNEAAEKGDLSPEEIRELIDGAEEVLDRSVPLLDADPSGKNMEAVLEDLELYFQLGGEGSEKVWISLRKGAGTLRQRAEQEFRRNPGLENYDKLLDAELTNGQLGGPVMVRPTGFRGARPGTFHTTVIGNTLSRISQTYYGTPGYWDLVYQENLQKIGENPDRLPIGVMLKIP